MKRLVLFSALALFGCSSNGVDLQAVQQFLAAINAIDDVTVQAFDTRRQEVAPGTERNINWDGAAVTVLTQGATATFPPDLFLLGAGLRQILIGGVTDEDIAVSEDSFATLPGGAANPSAGGGFAPLTGTVNFAALGTRSVTISFTTADNCEAGLIHGMAVVFTDVEVAGRSGLRFFDRAGNLLRDVRAVAGASGGHQLVGAVFDTPIVATVVIDMGDNNNFGTGVENPLGGGDDFVVVDDFRFFLSGTAIPTTDIVAPIAAIGDDAVVRFDRRRLTLAQGNERNINWDGGAVIALTQGQTAPFPAALFRDGAGFRQIIVGGATGETTGVSEDSFATLPDGANNPSAGGGFAPLTGTVNFAGVGRRSVTVSFTTLDTNEAGLVHGFGAVFSDVEVAGRSGLRFYDRAGVLIRDVRAVAGPDGGHQFVAAVFAKPIVATVVIDLGDNDNFGTGVENPLGGGDDYVVVDDFRFFLSQTPVPPTTFVEAVTTRGDDVFTRYDRRRLPLAQGNERNVNWDAGAVTGLTQGGTADFPPALFLDGAGFRQLNIGDPGEEVVVTEDAFATLQDGSANPSGADGRDAFTPNVTFSVFNGNTVTVRFFLADRITPALVHGFGAVFTDAEIAGASGLRFFAVDGALLLDVRAAAQANGTHQFVGGVLNSALIARVEIDFGDNATFGAAGENLGALLDHVVVDDLIFFQSTTAQPE